MALETQLDNVRYLIDTLRKEWDVPGVAVGIIKDDEVIFSEGFGHRDIVDEKPVTRDTLFAVGSVTKSFVTMGLGLLVDDGELDWDKPVRHYLPDFALYDSFASERITPRDLVTHRSGLPRHEKMWYGSPYDRPELIRRLRYLQPNTDFRTTFHYQNMMFVTAGYLIGQVAGSTWEEFTQERILDPLGMSTTLLTLSGSVLTPMIAQPYLKPKVGDTSLQKTPFYNNDICAPAGAIYSSLNDIATWVRLHLNKGKLNDTQFVAENTINSMHTPQTLINNPEFRALHGEDFYAYGMGWFIHPYRGRTVIRHGGAIDGYIAQVGFIPQDQLGVIVFANLNETVLPMIAFFTIIDLILNLDPIEWDAQIKALVSKDDDEVAKKRQKTDEERVSDAPPSHPLDAYTGAYEHPGYGVMRIELTEDGEALRVQYNGLPSEVTHYHYDIFELYNELYEDNRWIKLRFQTGIDGSIESLVAQMELAPGIDPIVFRRKTNEVE